MPYGEKIRKAATAQVLSQDLALALRDARGTRPRSTLAASAGVAESTLARLELERGNPTLAYIEGLGQVYGIRFRLVAEDQAVELAPIVLATSACPLSPDPSPEGTPAP